MNNLQEQLQTLKNQQNTYQKEHKTLGVSFEVPNNNQAFKELSNSKNKIFFALSVIEYILTCIGEDEIEFKTKIKVLLKKYQQINLEKMGFIENWENNPIWSDNE